MPSLSRPASSSKLWNAHCDGSIQFGLVRFGQKGVKQWEFVRFAFQLTFQKNTDKNKVNPKEK